MKREEAKEFFAVSTNHFASCPDDSEAVKSALVTMFPTMNISLHILERCANGLLYEWVALEDHVEKVHGWGRTFSSEEGTAVLGYQTRNISAVDKARSIWLPVLRTAKQQP